MWYETKKRRKLLKDKKMKNSNNKTLLNISIIAIFLTITSCESKTEKQNETVVMTHNNASEMTHNIDDNQLIVKSSLVCYVNNKYMGKEQIPVDFDGKVYFGCCEGCVLNLNNNRDVRYAKDPLTGEMVDKALAIISLKSANTDDVYYFASMKNYRDFME